MVLAILIRVKEILWRERLIREELVFRANAAVLEAYGFPKDITEPEIVAELFKMYQELTAK